MLQLREVLSLGRSYGYTYNVNHSYLVQTNYANKSSYIDHKLGHVFMMNPQAKYMIISTSKLEDLWSVDLEALDHFDESWRVVPRTLKA